MQGRTSSLGTSQLLGTMLHDKRKQTRFFQWDAAAHCKHVGCTGHDGRVDTHSRPVRLSMDPLCTSARR